MKNIDMIATGKKLKQLRLEHQRTVREVAQRVGINNVTAVYVWERGLTIPTVDHLVELADMYQVKIDDLIIREEH